MASYDVNTYDNVFSNISKEAFSAAVIIILAIMIFFIIVSWKIYKKMGAPGWASLVPIYNIVVLLKKVKLSLIYLLLLMIPIVNFFAIIKIIHSLSKAFGKDVKYTIFTIIFPFFSLPILAFGNSTYVYENEKKEDDLPVENVDTEYVYCPKCNTRLAQNADSCFICGYKIKGENNTNTKIENAIPVVTNTENNNVNTSVQSPIVTLGGNGSVVDNSSVASTNNQNVTNNINPSTANNSTFESNQEIIKNYNIPDDITPNPAVASAMEKNVGNTTNNDLYQNVNNDINTPIYSNNQIDVTNANLDLNIQDNLANNNAPSIEEMFNFDYNNVTEANNLISNINNNQIISDNSQNIDYNNPINTNQVTNDNNQNMETNNSINASLVVDNNAFNTEYNNASSNLNAINDVNINGDNNFDIFNNQDIIINNNDNLNSMTNNTNYNTPVNYSDIEETKQNTEVLDLNFQEALKSENNTEKQNTEILNFSADDLKVNDTNNEQLINQDVVFTNQADINLNSANVANGVEDVRSSQGEIPVNVEQVNPNNNVINNNVHVSPIKKPDGYRVCPICGSKVLPNATNCVICGSKV